MSPKTSDQFTAIREKSRAKILKAAIDLFSKYGYLEVSVSQIADRAGVAKGLLYNYFESKEDVLKAVIDLMMDDFGRFMIEIAKEDDPRKEIEQTIRLSCKLLRDKQHFYKNILSIITQNAVSAKIRKELQGFMSTAVAEIERTLDKGGVANAKAEAFKLGAILDGIAWHYLFVYGDAYPLAEMEETLVNQYVGMIR